MATTTSITTTYAGEFAGKYIAAALLSGNTLAAEAITVKPNVKFKEVIKKVDTAGIIADATCDFTSAGTVALTERILQVKEMQINLELCKTPFESDWEAAAMGYSSFDELPKNFSDFFPRGSKPHCGGLGESDASTRRSSARRGGVPRRRATRAAATTAPASRLGPHEMRGGIQGPPQRLIRRRGSPRRPLRCRVSFVKSRGPARKRREFRRQR